MTERLKCDFDATPYSLIDKAQLSLVIKDFRNFITDCEPRKIRRGKCVSACNQAWYLRAHITYVGPFRGWLWLSVCTSIPDDSLYSVCATLCVQSMNAPINTEMIQQLDKHDSCVQWAVQRVGFIADPKNGFVYTDRMHFTADIIVKKLHYSADPVFHYLTPPESGKLSLNIEHFRAFIKEQKPLTIQYGEPLMVGGVRWRLRAQISRANKYRELFLIYICCVDEDLPDDFVCDVSLKIFIHSHHGPREDIVCNFDVLSFDAQTTSYSWFYMNTWDLLKRKHGYVLDDTLSLSAEIFVKNFSSSSSNTSIKSVRDLEEIVPKQNEEIKTLEEQLTEETTTKNLVTASLSTDVDVTDNELHVESSDLKVRPATLKEMNTLIKEMETLIEVTVQEAFEEYNSEDNKIMNDFAMLMLPKFWATVLFWIFDKLLLLFIIYFCLKLCENENESE